jgi:ribosomal protein S18 acetylase RimI-like enzyme
MQQKLNNFTSTILIPAIEESLQEFWANWGHSPRSELYDVPGMIRLYTGIPYAFCNGVVCSQLPADDIDATVDETIAYFRARNATWEWIIGPNPTPASLDKTLTEHGLSVQSQSFGMAVSLRDMNQEIPLIKDLRIQKVGDDETLKIWANTLIQGFEAPALDPSYIDLECSLGYQLPSYCRYLAVLNHQPVAVSALFLGEKVAGIYCVATLPAVRRLGIGAAITHYALREAQAMGYHIAVLQASQMGRSVYQRLGFQVFSTLRGYSPTQ